MVAFVRLIVIVTYYVLVAVGCLLLATHEVEELTPELKDWPLSKHIEVWRYWVHEGSSPLQRFSSALTHSLPHFFSWRAGGDPENICRATRSTDCHRQIYAVAGRVGLAGGVELETPHGARAWQRWR